MRQDSAEIVATKSCLSNWGGFALAVLARRNALKLSIKILLIVVCSAFLSSTFASDAAGKKKKSSDSTTDLRIVVFAHRSDQGIEYRINQQSYTSEELNYALGEMHIGASKRSGIAVVLEDDMRISDVKAVPRMALDAGFEDVRVYVYWKGTGHMAEILFGPVLKFGLDPKKF
jgi:hypothetical protein